MTAFSFITLSTSLLIGMTSAAPQQLYYNMKLERNCGCERSDYHVMAKYADGRTHHLYEKSDGVVQIPLPDPSSAEYNEIVGVGVMSISSRPTAYRMIKKCRSMPYKEEQIHWTQPVDGGLIPIDCDETDAVPDSLW